jgi:hypothetical protein
MCQTRRIVACEEEITCRPWGDGDGELIIALTMWRWIDVDDNWRMAGVSVNVGDPPASFRLP